MGTRRDKRAVVYKQVDQTITRQRVRREKRTQGRWKHAARYRQKKRNTAGAEKRSIVRPLEEDLRDLGGLNNMDSVAR